MCREMDIRLHPVAPTMKKKVEIDTSELPSTDIRSTKSVDPEFLAFLKKVAALVEKNKSQDR